MLLPKIVLTNNRIGHLYRTCHLGCDRPCKSPHRSGGRALGSQFCIVGTFPIDGLLITSLDFQRYRYLGLRSAWP
jgi:hypothetical protein